MKQLLLLLALLLATPLAHAQKVKEDDSPPTLPIDPDTHLVTYTGVVEVPGTSQAQLYSRAYEWVVKSYKSAPDVLQMQDKESGKIILKGNTHALIRGRDGGIVNHTFSIYLKDGKYKYDVTDFVNVNPTPKGDYGLGHFENDKPSITMPMMNGIIQKSWNILRRNTDADIKAMLADLQAAMTVKTKDKSDF
ncbi:DUF4468 domain-containing protein [Hymenobacter terricola]|uniref:DUF4468 domain-containing protein n=1 Tax=Hymenobacter terricola TaxID=2819236 RepID=UPI001B305859|nr:DUF4468 domain-containing protein [Hymenobacter terricola]